MKVFLSIPFAFLLFSLLVPSALCDQQVLHRLDNKYVNEDLLNGYFVLNVRAKTVEIAMAQVIRFYERYGWGRTESIQYSGIPLIYEYAPLPDDVKPFDVEIRSGNLNRTMEFLCKRTKGACRENLFKNSVLVIRKQTDSLLFDLDIDRIERSKISIGDAITLIVAMANRSDPNVRIQFERPSSIKIREGNGPEELIMYRTLPGSILDHTISLDVSGSNLIDGLVDVLLAQPVPFYLTLKPGHQNPDFTHVLRFDSLPYDELTGIKRAYPYFYFWY